MRNVSDEGRPWDDRLDFTMHHFFGGGRTVTVRETGYLEAVVAEFRRQAGDVPTRLPGQIADKARAEVDGRFTDKFEAVYEMQEICFSLGDTTISGTFSGTRKPNHALLELRGTISFELNDWFRDPADIGEKVPRFLERIDVLIREAEADGAAGIEAIETYLDTRIGGLPFALTDYVRDRIIAFRDNPEKLPTELGGTPYRIVDRWGARFPQRS